MQLLNWPICGYLRQNKKNCVLRLETDSFKRVNTVTCPQCFDVKHIIKMIDHGAQSKF